ncbi:response regulator [Streptomyces fructofermentans]|uniref:Response regulator n=1 Tax=Streptomyces fructofermentans TaxID=152141 RepID=A0A918KDB4_9ACTN|nr:response regulator [Streptomyces fructofermentans]GGX57845.1 response regulator [Streptomyces fructofermentans]
MLEGARRIDPGSVLVVEDSQEDAEAIQRALSSTHPALRLEFVHRGEGVVDALLASDVLPGLVLLDLNMPGMDGHGLLGALRARPEFRDVTLVVFTSSTAPAEVDRCYAAGADSYIYKPVNFTLFRTVLKGAVDYWQQSRAQAVPEPPEGSDGSTK